MLLLEVVGVIVLMSWCGFPEGHALLFECLGVLCLMSWCCFPEVYCVVICFLVFYVWCLGVVCPKYVCCCMKMIVLFV